MRAFSSEVHRPFILAGHAVKMTDTYTERVTQRMNTSYRHREGAAVSLTIALISVLVALMTAPQAIMARVGADPVRPMEAPVSLTDGFSDLGTPSDGDEEDDEDDDPDISEYDQMPPNRIWREAIGLEAIQDEYAGDGVTVAVIDTGVSRTPDLDDAIMARVDLTPDRDGMDRYGHGTHMIGIIAGDGAASDGDWRGVAPSADIVSIKVAGWDGASDVSAVMAALEWAVAYRDRYGIRVLNLSYGTDGTQPYGSDPLDRAVERAWEAGILVVTSAGNRGPMASTISKPADDPHVLTVGASHVNGTPDTGDDVVAAFSSRGPTADAVDKPDLVAPGITIVASRAAGSTIDTFRPEGRVDDAYFKGTGTSQAAAVVSGIAALLFEADPSLTPSQVKTVLMDTARPLPGQAGAGAGQVDAHAAIDAVRAGSVPRVTGPGPVPSSGAGSIDASRGTHKVFADVDADGLAEQVSGELDALGQPFDATLWTSKPWVPSTWTASAWASVSCVAEGWTEAECGSATWGGMSWDAQWWGHRTWSEAGWDQKSWTQKSWTQKSWTAGHWN
jgi:serine protease AprX